MKKLILLFALLAGGFFSQMTDAQVSVHINISSQPIWGPVGYDYVDYYYIPDIEAYYYVPKHRFIYLEGNRWVSRAALPPRYHDFDLYKVDKVVINEPEPYLHHDVYKAKYISYRGRHDQAVIRDSHDQRYYVIKDHPEHKHWKEEQKGRGHKQKEDGNDQHGDRR
ncbi:MAG TPA: hypothetical protein VIH57_02770 [Bacteroidales bacterium]